MKIAIIGHKRLPSNESGIEKGVEEHAVRMVRLGHQVTAYNRSGRNIFGQEGGTVRRKKYKGIKIITIPTVKGAACVPIYSFLATVHAAIVRYDCVSYRASGSCVMIPLAKLLGLRVVASLHGIDSQRDKWGAFASGYLELGERMAAKRADVCLVLSRNMKEYIDNKYGVHSVVSANGIDCPIFQKPQIIREKYGLAEGSYVLSLGRLVPEKGIHILIDAFKQCKTDKKLVIAGGGEPGGGYEGQLKEQAAEDSRIIFTGHIQGQEIRELYSGAYLFAMPSLLEGMSNSLLEAMSYGNCCLVSDIPENAEVIGEHAVLFKKGDRADLREKLRRLLDDPKIVQRFRRGAGPYVLGRYNWDVVVKQLLRVYSGDVVDYETVLRETAAAQELCEK